MMLRVPHASGLRVGVLVPHYAEGIEALLRARGFTFSHIQLLPPVAAVGNSGSPNGIRRCAGENPGALSISAGWICGDARARTFVDQRASASYAIGGAESSEAKSFARRAKEIESSACWAVPFAFHGARRSSAAILATQVLRLQRLQRQKRREKLEYMHANPVTRELVQHPKDWPWSSFSYYAKGESGFLPIDPVV